VHPSTPWSSQWSPSSRLSHQYHIYIFFFSLIREILSWTVKISTSVYEGSIWLRSSDKLRCV
jgi:hypothetical protein